jgi:hypothetical protein
MNKTNINKEYKLVTYINISFVAMKIRKLLILTNHLHLGLPNGSFLLDFPPITYSLAL